MVGIGKIQTHQLFVSDIVYLEASRGDAARALQRLDLLTGIPRLSVTEDCKSLAQVILDKGDLSAKAKDDALHIAIATVHQMDVLLTWNCRHIANPVILRKIREIISPDYGRLPEICTPEEMIGD